MDENKVRAAIKAAIEPLENRISVLEDCESALPAKEYKHKAYGSWWCKCGYNIFGDLPNFCPDCGHKRGY